MVANLVANLVAAIDLDKLVPQGVPELLNGSVLMNLKKSGPCWKGLLASFIVSGAGQFFQGNRKRAAFAFLTTYGLVPVLLLILIVPLVPPILALLLVPLGWIASLYFLIDTRKLFFAELCCR